MMETTTREVLRKTGKGADELRSRRHGLGPRLRQLLILIDGRREVAELARMLPGPDLAGQLERLERDGFVARSALAEPAVAERARSHATPTPAQAAAPAGAPAAVPEDLRTLCARVTRALHDTIGPHGDDFALRIERVRTIDELRELLPAVLSIVEACNGRAGIDGFLRRCGAM